jgi:hypothetical protein
VGLLVPTQETLQPSRTPSRPSWRSAMDPSGDDRDRFRSASWLRRNDQPPPTTRARATISSTHSSAWRVVWEQSQRRSEPPRRLSGASRAAATPRLGRVAAAATSPSRRRPFDVVGTHRGVAPRAASVSAHRSCAPTAPPSRRALVCRTARAAGGGSGSVAGRRSGEQGRASGARRWRSSSRAPTSQLRRRQVRARTDHPPQPLPRTRCALRLIGG